MQNGYLKKGYLKKGFTVAEVLITLTIIGVVAAMVLPSLLNTVPDNNKVMYKKAHAVLEQSVQTMVNGNAFSDGNLGLPASKNFCEVFSQVVNIVGSASCSGNATSADSPSFVTADGIYWYLTQNYNKPVDTSTSSAYDEDSSSNANYVHIVVDVNGPSKKPNCGAAIQSSYSDSGCADPDRFMFGVRYDGKVSVFGDVAA